jgi:S1-C subfamily serine protease
VIVLSVCFAPDSFKYDQEDHTMNTTARRLAIGTMLLVTIWSRAPAVTPADIAVSALRSVVVVETRSPAGVQLGLGTGFFVRNGVFVSNLHVLEGAASATIRLVNQQRAHAVEGFIAVDRINDLVLLQVAAEVAPPLKLSAAESSRVGDDVFVLGNPLGLEGTFSRGMISAKREIKGKSILQITAPISPGSSGGPVLSSDGSVVGVAVAYIEDGQNLNFAAPADAVSALMRSVLPVRALTQLPPLGSEKRISPDDIYASGSMRIGHALITIGMPIADAVAKLETFYKVSGGPESYMAMERKDGRYSLVGSVKQDKGKVVAASHQVKSIDEQEPAAALMRELYALSHQITQDNNGLCALRTSRRAYSYGGIGQGTVYTVTLSFGHYEVDISYNDAQGDISRSISLSESLGKMR